MSVSLSIENHQVGCRALTGGRLQLGEGESGQIHFNGVAGAVVAGEEDASTFDASARWDR